MTDASVNAYALDAAYKAFPTFSDWAAKTTIDTVRWDRYTAALKERGDLSPAALQRARQIATRAAAIDTGALEGLYESDRGFTYTVAFETAAWESVVAARGDQVRPLFEAQLHGYEFVLTLATGAEPISEAAIRELHVQMCAAQDTYRVTTSVGFQDQPLPKGRYKALPNHVLTRDGVPHSYAPVDITPDEVARLVRECRSDAFLAAHPVVQAAYAHYGLVATHPFADGNGRVARALASAFTYRSISMPIVVLSDTKTAYLDALATADAGNYQAFVDFLLARSIETIELVVESLQGETRENTSDLLAELVAIYESPKLIRSVVDGIGRKMQDLVLVALASAFEKAKATRNVDAQVSYGPGIMNSWNDDVRLPEGDSRSIQLGVGTKEPASAAVYKALILWLPVEASPESEIYLRAFDTGEFFSARIQDLEPRISAAVQLRASIFAERVLADMLATLRPLALASLESKL